MQMENGNEAEKEMETDGGYRVEDDEVCVLMGPLRDRVSWRYGRV